MINKVIYIIEDNSDVAHTLEFAFSELGFKVLTFTNASSCNAAVESDKPDVFLIDAQLPEDSGLKLCQQLKSDNSTAVIPILLMSASKLPVQYEAKMANDFIFKPFDLDKIVGKISSLITST